MNTFDFPVTVCSLATEFAMKTSGEQLLPPRLAASQVWHPTAVGASGAGAPVLGSFLVSTVDTNNCVVPETYRVNSS